MLEASGNMSSSKWLEKTLAPSTFNVTFKGGNVLALDKRDEALDKAFYWLDEKGRWKTVSRLDIGQAHTR